MMSDECDNCDYRYEAGHRDGYEQGCKDSSSENYEQGYKDAKDEGARELDDQLANMCSNFSSVIRDLVARNKQLQQEIYEIRKSNATAS